MRATKVLRLGAAAAAAATLCASALIHAERADAAPPRCQGIGTLSGFFGPFGRIEVRGGSRVNGAPVVYRKDPASTNQQWCRQPHTTKPNVFIFRAAHSNRCLDESLTARRTVIQWTCKGSSNQLWYMQPFGTSHSLREGPSYFQFVNLYSLKCLSPRLTDGPRADGLQLITTDCKYATGWALGAQIVNRP